MYLQRIDKVKLIIRHDCHDPHSAELIEAKEGLPFTWKMGFRRVYLEGDAQNVYTSIQDSSEDLTYNGSILQDIYLYAFWFSFFYCSFIPRECNYVAGRCLASLVFSLRIH